MNTAQRLMLSWMHPLRAPEGLGGGIPEDTGDDSGFDDFGDDFADDNGGEDDGIEDDDKITLDDDDPLDKLFKASSDPDDNSGDDDSDEGPTAEQISAELKQAIDSFQITEDMIPEDFNPNDPKSMREFMGTAGKAMIQTALATMFKPVQATLNSMQKNIRKEMATSIQDAISGNNTNAKLTEAIPAYGDPALREVIDPLFTRAKKAHKGDIDAAIRSTKNALKAIGINPNGRQNPAAKDRNRNRDLDLYAPLPKPSQSQGNRNRMRGTNSR